MSKILLAGFYHDDRYKNEGINLNSTVMQRVKSVYCANNDGSSAVLRNLF